MKKRFLPAVCSIILFLFFAGASAAQEDFQGDSIPIEWTQLQGATIHEESQATLPREVSVEPEGGWGYMRPTDEQLQEWQFEHLTNPKAFIDPYIQAVLEAGPEAAGYPKPLLLDYIPYTSVERNQGSCGNCWVWAATAIVEAQHSWLFGVHDRLSIQFFDTNKNNAATGPPDFACCGGNLGKFADYYGQSYHSEGARRMIPWTNSNAYYQDGSDGCPNPYYDSKVSSVAPSAISNAPYYYYPTNMVPQSIDTYGVGQTTAINNIKNVLNQGKVVGYNFALPDFNTFRTFWNTQNEDAIWAPDSYCGTNWDTGPDKGAHAVVIVGYNDDDASTSNHYWIVLNSWGAPSLHPNGLFHLKMYMNYDCVFPSAADSTNYLATWFETLAPVPFDDTGGFTNIIKGASSNTIYVRNLEIPFSVYSPWQVIDGGGSTSHAPATAMFNSRLYVAVKGASNNNIYVRNRYRGTWSSWQTIPGATNVSPALVVYKNRLYLFVKGATSGTIYYKSLGTSGGWSSTWSTVPGSSTSDTPAVVAYDDRLILFQKGWSTNTIYIFRMHADLVWHSWTYLPTGASPSGPAATVYDGYIWVFVRGMSDDVWYTKLWPDGNGYYGWSNSCGGKTSTTPRVTREPYGYLTLFLKGATSNHIYSQGYSQIEGWTGIYTQEPGLTSDTPMTNSYWPD